MMVIIYGFDIGGKGTSLMQSQPASLVSGMSNLTAATQEASQNGAYIQQQASSNLEAKS